MKRLYSQIVIKVVKELKPDVLLDWKISNQKENLW